LQCCLDQCSEEALVQRWTFALAQIDMHWTRLLGQGGVRALVSPSASTLRRTSFRRRLLTVLGRLRARHG
jgi:hypothetical protein